tara:strand:- start:281 stop:493 length:213 start_codon:yes stop_codon:yes gene_type:complete
MIENYKGWDISLNCSKNKSLKIQPNIVRSQNQYKRWVGVDLKGQIIYGSSLKEIRHIIDYPRLHNKKYII